VRILGRASATATAAALLLAASVTHAEAWQSHVGKACPEVSADTWVNTGGKRPSNASLKGKVWLLWFFGST
jgi:hypothetical protein